MIIKKIKLKIITNNNSKIILGHFYVVCNKWLLNQQAVMEGGYSGKILQIKMKIKIIKLEIVLKKAKIKIVVNLFSRIVLILLLNLLEGYLVKIAVVLKIKVIIIVLKVYLELVVYKIIIIMVMKISLILSNKVVMLEGCSEVAIITIIVYLEIKAIIS